MASDGIIREATIAAPREDPGSEGADVSWTLSTQISHAIKKV